MSRSSPSLFARLALAIRSLFTITLNPEFAARVQALRAGEQTPPEPAAPPVLRENEPAAAMQLLGLLQRDARFVDFVQEDLAGAADADIGAAARIVHEGCRKVLAEYFEIAPVRDEEEGQRLTLAEGFDAAAVRLTGNVVGSAPFSGTLCHRGWRITASRLPKLVGDHDPAILAPAEVEL